MAFPLHPETPREGRSLADLFAGRPVSIDDMLAQLRGVARAEGLPFGDRTMTYNSRLAQELGKWAESKGHGHAYHWAAFKAYFADGKNIARNDVLLEIAENAGLEPRQAQSIIEVRTQREAVDRDWQRSMELGVRVVPTLLMGGEMLVGAQPYAAIEQLVRRHFKDGSGTDIQDSEM